MDRRAETIMRKRLKREKRQRNARLQRFNDEHKKHKKHVHQVAQAPFAISETKTEVAEMVAVEKGVPVVHETLSGPVEAPKT